MITSFVSFIFTIRARTEVARDILAALDAHFHANYRRYELIVVCNGGRIDLGVLKAQAEGSKSLIHILELGHETSFETAALVGLDKAIGDFVFFLEEARLDFDLDLTLPMMARIYENNDVVFLSSGTRALDLASRTFYFIFNLGPRSVTLGPARLVLVSRRALGYALDQNHLIRFHRILFLMGGFQTRTISYVERPVRAFEIKSLYDRLSLAKELLLYYTFVGRNLSFIAAAFFISFAVVIFAYALYSYFFLSAVVSGWTSLMLFLSFGFVGVFVLLGILVEHLQKILFNSQKRPLYNLKGSLSNFEHVQPASAGD